MNSVPVTYKETKYIAKQPLLVIRDEIVVENIDDTVAINGELYRVVMITDNFTNTKYGTEWLREVKLVEKKYY